MASRDTDDDIIIAGALLIASMLYRRRQLNVRKHSEKFMGTQVDHSLATEQEIDEE